MAVGGHSPRTRVDSLQLRARTGGGSPTGRMVRMGPYLVRVVPWSKGFELHVEGVGVTQCVDRADATRVTRDFLSTMSRDDWGNAELTFVDGEPGAGR